VTTSPEIVAPRAGYRYVDGRLTAAGVALESVLSRLGSAWAYDGERIDAAARALVAAFPAPRAGVRYAIKANSNPAVLARVRAHGLGAEVASGGVIPNLVSARPVAM